MVFFKIFKKLDYGGSDSDLLPPEKLWADAGIGQLVSNRVYHFVFGCGPDVLDLFYKWPAAGYRENYRKYVVRLSHFIRHKFCGCLGKFS